MEMDAWSVGLAVGAVLLAVYYYLSFTASHYSKYGIPYRRPLPLLGNSWGALFRMKPFAEVIVDCYTVNDEAKYVGFYDLMTPVTMIRDPDLIKQIAVKHFDSFPDHRSFMDDSMDPLFGKNLFSLRGDRWKEVRSIVSPTFTSSKMKAMFLLMQECAVYFTDYLSQLPDEQKQLDAKDAFTRYTNDVIATCAFGISINSMKDRNNPFYVYGREATNFGTIATLKFFFLRSAPFLSKLLKLRIVRKEISDFFQKIMVDTIKARDEKGITRPDMIQLMMETRGKMEPGKELTIEDMTAQAFVFFFGGFESTSALMSFTAHELVVNPEVQERLQDEIDSVLEETNGKLTYEALNDMKYMDAVVNESLRMYPIAVAGDRWCTKDYELPPCLPGAKPYTIKAGEYVWFPIYAMQRDPKYFDEPNRFNPDRFMGENAKKIVNGGYYLPFGLGPRMCIGNRFALLETKCLLFNLLARCDLKICPKTDIPLQLNRKGFAMTAQNGFWMKIDRRSKVHPSIAQPVQNGTANGIANGSAR